MISNICLITQLQLIIDQVTILLNFNLKCQFSKKKIKMTLLTIISPKWIPIEQIECCSELFVPVVYRLKNFFWTFVLRWVDLKNYIRIFICLKIDLVKKNCRKTLFPKVSCWWFLSHSTVVRKLASFGTWPVLDHLRATLKTWRNLPLGKWWYRYCETSPFAKWSLGRKCPLGRHLHLAEMYFTPTMTVPLSLIYRSTKQKQSLWETK